MLRLDLSFEIGAATPAGVPTVPVRLPDGTPAGRLRGRPVAGAGAVDRCQVQGMTIVAGLIGQELDQQRAEERRRAARRTALRQLCTGYGTAVALQPICRLDSGEPVGYEALSRFGGTDGEPVAADAVFQEAHALGLGVELEMAAAAAALTLLPQVVAPTYLSINLSPAALLDPATAALCAGVPAHRLVLELTEHEQITDYAAVSAALAPLRGRGVRLAVDDAGAGFASLQHISRLKPDLIKLDRALVQAVQDDPSRRALVRAMVGFARETGAGLIAEGVEADAERRQLLALGVELGQGFLLGRPAAPSRWLTRYPGRAGRTGAERCRHRTPAA